MTKFRSLARARVIGPDEEEGSARGEGASSGAGKGAAGVDILVL